MKHAWIYEKSMHIVIIDPEGKEILGNICINGR
jgi:hypothetical protein